ncbi:MAG: flagellar hook capping FlgD N-terminal domain-containing protein [Lachnospiraceae bacterium]|nr:flagellar hook capping FlgD N-terminal domain-containing protein [Lachnospiraceae bacterium]
MPDISALSGSSGTNSVYSKNTAAANNEKGSLDIQSYFKLLAAQLANQDMSNPMDTSDMMNQMSQMAMVQSLTAMTESIKTSTALSQQSYAASLIGKKVTYLASAGTGADGSEMTVTKTGIVSSVSLSGKNPTIRIEGDDTDYSLERIQSVLGNTTRDTKNADSVHES